MKKIFTWMMVMALALSLTGCGNLDLGAGGGGSTLEKAKNEGVIKVGFANEKPYAYRDENGKVTGEAVEISKTIFKRMGIEKVEPVLTDFSQLIPGLKAGRFDVITAGMYITPKRCKEVAFADPEYQIGEGLAVKKGNPKDLHSYQDIVDNKDVTVGVMQGAIEIQYLQDLGVKDSQIKQYSDQPSVVQALKSGRVDAITMTGPSLREVLAAQGTEGIETVEDFKQPVIDGKSVVGYGAAAFKKDDTEFRDQFTKELNKMEKSGELLDILKQFNFAEENLPGDLTHESLCKG
ncbi:MAG: ectoine/hydroxyectoine ABC transporter substrate-binding protein EhuB [Firmicutes bacterium]|uniref:Amino acid ABC transporter substrate-binding protein, PAAT family (TC 3.A.1.3.-) n=1 Tax=Melghirimyces thermohalophilus TaxID=1236220 RepID=A0A1G6MY24_9BACL|nr:ectoine/hydroxyectoine ABC transporter substrate-binding protein EhuB [Melghirimyces thermohalophilus]MDA8351676.1 ectoine/hydroxyectoine ABC transporter substrate-binding protein EhuB [Bacillota bacterium]SDC60452.1 amino acid ABC transporter substrate-binding protein, PAAT family (TC 3.A.1.3.-) [Melghirimyces thermohalophilus]